MTQASIKAHEAIQPKAPSMREQIFQRLSKQHLTCGQLEFIFGWEHQTVSARLSELREEGLIVEKGIVNDQTEWGVTPEHLIETMKKEIAFDKFQRWLKGAERHKDFIPDGVMNYLNNLKR